MVRQERTRCRPAEVTDLAALVGLERALFGRDAWSEAAMADELAQVPDLSYAIVAATPVPEARGRVVPSAGTQVIGYAVLRSGGATAEVLRIGVASAYQQRGTGRTLLADLLTEARRRACTEVLLEVAASNAPALALYHSFGFAELAHRPGYYGGGEDAVVLRQPTDFTHDTAVSSRANRTFRAQKQQWDG